MICSAFLEDIRTRVDDLVRRAHLEKEALTVEQLNSSPEPSQWSVGQLFDHMNISARLYLPSMEQALDRSQFGSRDSEVRHTMIGAAIAKAAGPGGNAPVPPGMAPGKGPYDKSVIDEFIQLHEKLSAMSRTADGIDLRRAKVPNPMMKLISMNLADCFAILAGHGERHMGQISDLRRRKDFPA